MGKKRFTKKNYNDYYINNRPTLLIIIYDTFILYIKNCIIYNKHNALKHNQH